MCNLNRPVDLIVFFVGGVTYGEIREIEKLKISYPQHRILIGATEIHNSTTYFFILGMNRFLQQVLSLTGHR